MGLFIPTGVPAPQSPFNVLLLSSYTEFKLLTFNDAVIVFLGGEDVAGAFGARYPSRGVKPAKARVQSYRAYCRPRQNVDCFLEWVAPGDSQAISPPKKAMICIWRDWEGMVHRDMPQKNATVNKEHYDAQLHLENGAIRLKSMPSHLA
uniref:DDE_Tnp_1_7 domain-containing protein n=1 Tax=Bursaphelenchus xylophilus TaxID=6326 RepID=A0A1I7SGJ6_BURXY